LKLCAAYTIPVALLLKKGRTLVVVVVVSREKLGRNILTLEIFRVLQKKSPQLTLKDSDEAVLHLGIPQFWILSVN
jgi:hypothetical protein